MLVGRIETEKGKVEVGKFGIDRSDVDMDTNIATVYTAGGNLWTAVCKEILDEDKTYALSGNQCRRKYIMGVSAAIMVPHPPLIIPQVGKGSEKGVQNTIDAYHAAAKMLAAQKPDTIVIISPHQTMYADYFHISPGEKAEGSFAQFSAPEVRIEVSYDAELAGEIGRLADERNVPAGTLGERERSLDHGTMVPLYYVNQYWSDYKLVRIGLSGLPLAMHYRLGQCIHDAAERLGRRVAVIASGDLSHHLKEDGPYGFCEEGPEYDKRIMDVMGRAAFEELFDFSEELLQGAGECGHRSFVIMAGVFDRMKVKVQRLSYEGPFGVGYGICTYEADGADEARSCVDNYERRQEEKLRKTRENEDAYVRLARQSVEAYVRYGRVLSVPEDLLSEMYERQAGVFVSIKEDGRLRGCIGTIQAACGSIAEEIIENAISASTRDPRFSPIRPGELEKLVISVDVLSDAQPISSPEELDVERYGVIVTSGYKRGLLLPNLEGVRTVEEQIEIAKQKAGITDGEEISLERFEVVRHK